MKLFLFVVAHPIMVRTKTYSFPLSTEDELPVGSRHALEGDIPELRLHLGALVTELGLMGVNSDDQ